MAHVVVDNLRRRKQSPPPTSPGIQSRARRRRRSSKYAVKTLMEEKQVGLAGEPTIFNAETRSIFDDFFVELVRMTPFEASFRITGIMVVGMVIFWIVYCIESNGFQTTDKSGQIRPSTRWEIFLYCLSVSSTLGSSPAEPIGSLSLLTANFHAVLVQMWVVFVTGVFFTRITRTKPHIKVAQKAVIGVFNDRPALMIRFAFNSSKEELVDVRYYMTYSRNTIGSSGKSFYKFDRLDVQKKPNLDGNLNLTPTLALAPALTRALVQIIKVQFLTI
ncbi:hypothetical protein AAMO2058_001148100 [Amorphochlora amoebiformis]